MALRDDWDRRMNERIDSAAAKIKDPVKRAAFERKVDTLRDEGKLGQLNTELAKH